MVQIVGKFWKNSHRIIPIEMREVRTEYQRLIGVEHVQHLIQLFRFLRLVHRLRADADVFAEVFTR